MQGEGHKDNTTEEKTRHIPTRHPHKSKQKPEKYDFPENGESTRMRYSVPLPTTARNNAFSPRLKLHIVSLPFFQQRMAVRPDQTQAIGRGTHDIERKTIQNLTQVPLQSPHPLAGTK